MNGIISDHAEHAKTVRAKAQGSNIIGDVGIDLIVPIVVGGAENTVVGGQGVIEPSADAGISQWRIPRHNAIEQLRMPDPQTASAPSRLAETGQYPVRMAARPGRLRVESLHHGIRLEKVAFLLNAWIRRIIGIPRRLRSAVTWADDNGIIAIGEINAKCLFNIIAILSLPGSATGGRGALTADGQEVEVLQRQIGWCVGKYDPPVIGYIALIRRGHRNMPDTAAVVRWRADGNRLGKTISRKTDDDQQPRSQKQIQY